MRFSKQNHSRIPMPGKPGTCRLQVRDLGVTLEGESILRDITFQLNCREIMALIGPNGAGKSSLFRSILGQIPYSGSIQFQLAGGYPSHPKIGYVPQSPSFDRGYPISVLDFFAAAISRWPVFLPVPGHLRDKVTECLARVHGEALIQKRIGTLSGGELQRVLLALALEPIPQILILDEPINGLDPSGIVEFRSILQQLNEQKNITILLSSHILSELQHLATVYGFLNKGILLEEISSEALHAKCANCIELTVSDAEKYTVLLEKIFPEENYKVLPGNTIRIYKPHETAESFSRLAAKNDVYITKMQTLQTSLEDYYMELKKRGAVKC